MALVGYFHLRMVHNDNFVHFWAAKGLLHRLNRYGGLHAERWVLLSCYDRRRSLHSIQESLQVVKVFLCLGLAWHYLDFFISFELLRQI